MPDVREFVPSSRLSSTRPLVWLSTVRSELQPHEAEMSRTDDNGTMIEVLYEIRSEVEAILIALATKPGSQSGAASPPCPNYAKAEAERIALKVWQAARAVPPNAGEAEFMEAAENLMRQAQHAADRFTGLAREVFGQSNFTDRYDDEGRCRKHANALQERIDRFAAARAARGK